jgi:hypothetical protein
VTYNADGTIFDLVISESKYSANGDAYLPMTETIGRQMSTEWIDAKIQRMVNSEDAAVAQTGQLLRLNRAVISRKVNVLDKYGVNRWNKVTLPE